MQQSETLRMGMAQTPEDVLRLAREYGARTVDFKFTDVPGTWQHFSVPTRALDLSAFVEGIGFDGSSIRGFQQINESDMLLLPDPSTAILDPFTAEPTLSLVCDVTQPGITRDPYTRDPRYIARKAASICDALCDAPCWSACQSSYCNCDAACRTCEALLRLPPAIVAPLVPCLHRPFA